MNEKRDNPQTIENMKEPSAKILSIKRVSDEEQYNAFTDLEFYENALWIAYRTGTGHVSPYGKIVIRTSKDDGETWEKIQVLEKEGIDLRDPRLKVIHNKLYLVCFSLIYYDKIKKKFNPGNSFIFEYDSSSRQFKEVLEFSFETYQGILWSLAYSKGFYYLGGYHYDRTRSSRPYAILWKSKSITGPYETVYEFRNGVLPLYFAYNEFDIIQPSEEEMLLLLRADSYHGAPKPGFFKRVLKGEGFPNWTVLASAHYPYTDWKLTPIRVYFKGPRGIYTRDGKVYGIGRYVPSWKTGYKKKSIMLFRIEENTFIPLLELARGRDGSYAGLYSPPETPNILYVSFYSDHQRLGTPEEGKINDIWFAKIAFSP